MKNKKQTIYLSSYDDIKNPFYGGGGAIAVHQTAKRLSKENDVHVLSWDYSGKKREMIEGICYERFGLPFLGPKIGMFAYQLSLPFVAQQKEFDLWFESFCPPFTTAFLPVFVKKPVVGIVHMLAAEDMERKYKLPFHLVQNAGLKKYNKIITTSEALKKTIHSVNPTSSITVISNGIDKISKPVMQKQKYFLFLGRIEIDQKGLDLLISAFKQFHSKNKMYKLIIAGTGDKKEIDTLKKLINEASLTKVVQLKGQVSGKVKEDLLKNAAGVLITSRFETYSLVALEAMAYGAPIVSFAINGLSWVPEKGAKKVKPFDLKLFTQSIETVLQKEKSKTMIKNGQEYAKQFTWDNIASQYKTYILKIQN